MQSEADLPHGGSVSERPGPRPGLAADPQARLVAELGAVRAQRDALRQAVTDRSQRVRDLESALARAERERVAAVDALAPLRSDLEKTRAALAERCESQERLESSARTLEGEIVERRRDADRREQERSKLLARVDALEAERTAASAEADRLRRELDTTRPRLAALQASLAQSARNAEQHEQERATLRERIQTLEQSLAERDDRERRLREELDTVRAIPAATADDLKQIRGIGPAYERALHAIGIRSYEQIAAWTPEQVEQIAQQIKVHPTRILRDDWIGRATELMWSRPAAPKPEP